MGLFAIDGVGRGDGALHLVFLLVSTYFGLRFLNAGFSAHKDRSGGGIKVWMVASLPWMEERDFFWFRLRWPGR